MSECDPCKAIDCANEDDFSLYNLQSGVTRPAAVPNTSEPCKGCGVIDCSDGSRLDDDFNLYRLQSELYPLVIPFGLNVPGAEIRLPCCGTDVVRTVPQGLSNGGFSFLIGQMLDECALVSPFCADAGGAGETSGPPVIQLRIVCCDASVVVRQVSVTTPMAIVDSIRVQMITECSLHSGCSGITGGYLGVLNSISVVDLALTQAITNLGIILAGFITNTPTSLENTSDLLYVTATTLDDVATGLETSINNLLDQVGLTAVQIAILDVGLEIANILHVISDLLDLLGDLAHLLAIGGDITAILQELVNLTTLLDNAATDLETAITALINAGSVTPRTQLVVDLALVVAEILRVIADIIDGYVASNELVDAFASNVPAELLDAATVAINAGNALTGTATELGNRLDDLQIALDAAIVANLVSGTIAAQIQADIDLGRALIAALLCMATALIRMAAVATAQATGVGMPAALAALEAVALCLEAAIVLLIATGDPIALQLATVLQDLVDALRDLALGSITAEEASRILQRAFLIMLVVMTDFLLRLLQDLERVWALLLQDAMVAVTISTRCDCDGFVVTRSIQAGLSASQRNAIYNSMILECAARCPPVLPPSTNSEDPIQLFASTAQSCLGPPCPDGSAFVWTIPAGRFIGQNQAQVNAAAHAQACIEAPSYRVCLSSLPTGCCIGVAFSVNITSGGLSSGAGNVWSLISGALPTGLSLVPHGTYLTLSGTPTGTGTWTFEIQMVATNGARNSRIYTMEGLQVLPLTLPVFQVGTPYSVQLTMSGSFGGTITFAVTAGNLPVGITLTAAGLLSGTPTSADAFSFQITGTVV